MKVNHLFVAVLAAGMLSSCGKKDDVTLPAAGNTAIAPAPARTSDTAFAKLPGKWLRPDGGYILEIRGVAPDGKMDAGYFNPRPINVAKAVAMNYPGSTCTLTHDPAMDQLKGDYLQAALKQTFDVYFTRVTP